MENLLSINDDYQVEVLYKKIEVEDFINKYLDIDTFINCCKQCGNFQTRWSCPPYDFDVVEYWRKYKYLHIIGYKTNFTNKVLQQTYNEKELNLLILDLFDRQKEYFYKTTKKLEEKYQDSVVLAWGKCHKCKECTRIHNEKCRYEKDMRYSIESLGGDVNKLSKELFDVELMWAKNGKLPPYYFSVIGLLTKNDENLSL